MRKVAIFVEGDTELILIRELLLRKFEWNVDLQFGTLLRGGDFNNDIKHYIPNPSAPFHFLIFHASGDNAVLKRILDWEKFLWKSGYEKIIGLRDMYSEAYKVESTGISEEINRKFIEGTAKTLKKSAQNPENISFHFAIMEIEAWVLVMHEVFQKLDPRLSTAFIREKLNINLKDCYPETDFFHPAKTMGQIYSLVGKTYDKHRGDIEAIASKLSLENYENLYSGNKCNAFKSFYEQLNLN